MSKYYVHNNGASWFVKEAKFFESQGRLSKPWGKNWKPLTADSIDDARKQAAKVYGEGGNGYQYQ